MCYIVICSFVVPLVYRKERYQGGDGIDGGGNGDEYRRCWFQWMNETKNIMILNVFGCASVCVEVESEKKTGAIKLQACTMYVHCTVS